MKQCLIDSCPLLEEIILDYCYGFKRFCVFGHLNLNKVQMYCKDHIDRVDIETPNLYYLLLNNSKVGGAPSMNLASCRTLTTFCYYGFLSKRFINSLSNFPVLEILILCLSSHRDNLNLSIHSL